MKNLISLILLNFFSTSLYAGLNCNEISEYAVSIMTDRQADEDIHTRLAVIDIDDLSKELKNKYIVMTYNAYMVKVEPTEDEKKKAISDYKNETYNICLKENQ